MNAASTPVRTAVPGRKPGPVSHRAGYSRPDVTPGRLGYPQLSPDPFPEAPQAPGDTTLRDRFEGPEGTLEDMDSDVRDLQTNRPADTSPAAKPGRRGRPAAALVSVCLGFFVIQLDVTVVNVALPAIQRQIGGSLAGLQWVVDAYTLALAAIMLTAGSAADRVGARRTFTLGLAAFAAGSAACAVTRPARRAARSAWPCSAPSWATRSACAFRSWWPRPATWSRSPWPG